MSSNGITGETEQVSPQFESIVAGEREGIGGILCNDPSGLCLAFKGNMDTRSSGIYTNLARLASQLKAAESSEGPPLITIESDLTSTLIKEYDGHAVAIRVPAVANDSTDEQVDEST